MLGSCPLWTSFEQVTWGIRFYPNKGSLGHLLQHENSSAGLNKRRLINLKPSGLVQIYCSFSWSIFLTTYRYMSIHLVFLLSLYKSIYLHFFVFFPFVCPPIYLICLTFPIYLIYLIYLSIDLSIYLSIYWPVYHSILFCSILFCSILFQSHLT